MFARKTRLGGKPAPKRGELRHDEHRLGDQGLAPAAGDAQRGTMPRRDDDNVIPFRRRPNNKPRKWTTPQDFGHDPRKAPRPPRKPGVGLGAWLRKAAPWAFIAALVALTVAWHFWGW